MPRLNKQQAKFGAYEKTLVTIETPWKGTEIEIGVEIKLTAKSCCKGNKQKVMAVVDGNMKGGGSVGIGGDLPFSDSGWKSPSISAISGKLPDCKDTLAPNNPKITIKAKGGAGISVEGEASVTLTGDNAGDLDFTTKIEVGWWAGAKLSAEVGGGVSGKYTLD